MLRQRSRSQLKRLEGSQQVSTSQHGSAWQPQSVSQHAVCSTWQSAHSVAGAGSQQGVASQQVAGSQQEACWQQEFRPNQEACWQQGAGSQQAGSQQFEPPRLKKRPASASATADSMKAAIATNKVARTIVAIFIFPSPNCSGEPACWSHAMVGSAGPPRQLLRVNATRSPSRNSKHPSLRDT